MPPLETRQACRIPLPIGSCCIADYRVKAMLAWSHCRLLGIGNRWLSPAFRLRISSAFAFATVLQWTSLRPALPSTSALASDAERRTIALLCQVQFDRLRLAIRELSQIYPRPKEVCCATA